MNDIDNIYKVYAGVPATVLVFSALGVLAVLLATVVVKVWQVLRVNLTEALKAERIS